MLWNKTSRAYL